MAWRLPCTRARVAASDLCGHTDVSALRAGTCCELGQIRASAAPTRTADRSLPGRFPTGRPKACERISNLKYSNLARALTVPKRARAAPHTRGAALAKRHTRPSQKRLPHRLAAADSAMASTSKKSLKAALALGGGLVTVGSWPPC